MASCQVPLIILTVSIYDCVLPFSFDAILVAAPSASRPADVAIARVYTARGAVVKQSAVYMYVLYMAHVIIIDESFDPVMSAPRSSGVRSDVEYHDQSKKLCCGCGQQPDRERQKWNQTRSHRKWR